MELLVGANLEGRGTAGMHRLRHLPNGDPENMINFYKNHFADGRFRREYDVS
jgi:hypothetical protein